MGGDGSGVSGLGLFASWELDLWGKLRAQRAAATAQYESAALDAASARESIAALVAKSWFMAREAAVQRAIAGDMINSAQMLVDLSRDRARVGRGDELEVSQAEASALSYRDVQLQADIARQNALRAIEILAGRYPSAPSSPACRCRRCPARCRPACPPSCWSAAPTCARPSAAWPPPSTAPSRRRPRGCPPSRSPPASAASPATCS
jgi:outer membrane protein TolC